MPTKPMLTSPMRLLAKLAASVCVLAADCSIAPSTVADATGPTPTGYSDVGPGFCTSANGKRPQTYLCDTTGGKQGCPAATPQSCAAVCSAMQPHDCVGFMTQTMAPDPSTCNLVARVKPRGSGTWVLQQPGSGLSISAHDGETRDHWADAIPIQNTG